MKVTVKTLVTLEKDDCELLANLANNLRSICANICCEGLHCSTECPLDKITEHAFDLADEISNFLAKSKNE